LLAEERLSAAVAWAERHAGALDQATGGEQIRLSIIPALVEAAGRAQDVQRAFVADADPDADPESFHHVEGRKTNPAAPLFQAASERASLAIRSAGEAVQQAAATVQRQLEGTPSADRLWELRRSVIAATAEQAAGALHVSLALKLKARSDEFADRDNGRDVRQRYAAALTAVEREEEFSGYRENDVHDQRTRADRKALGTFLHELCGNVCQPPQFDPAWRTQDVIDLARQLDEERDFTLMPILNDALLDAGCNSRQILRHCRGLQEHADEPIQHAPGCWVIETILEREQPFRERLPLGTAGAPKRRRTGRRT
jgi:hypothetical protein